MYYFINIDSIVILAISLTILNIKILNNFNNLAQLRFKSWHFEYAKS